MAEDLKDNFLDEGDAVIARQAGAELVGSAYEPVFPYVRQRARSTSSSPSDHVTAESGTGVVHMAPALGEDDYRACRATRLVFVNFVD